MPLSRQALDVLREVKEVARSTLVFPSIRSNARPLSENAMNAALRRMGFTQYEMTAHGFRAAASSILNERAFRPDVIEASLGHQDQNEIRRTYNRASYWQERIELRNGVGDPAIDVGLMLARAVGADFDLRREGALGNLAVNGGPRQAGPGEDGSQADDTVWLAHGCLDFCWLCLTAPEPDRTRIYRCARGSCAPSQRGSPAAENRIVLQSDAPASAKVDTVREGEFHSESAARFDHDAEVSLAAFEDGFKLRIAFKALRHVAHRRPRGLVTGHVARLVLVLAGAVEAPPTLHEAIGSVLRIGAQFGFEL